MKIVIISAEPAGLTAAWEFRQREYQVTILKATESIGGIFGCGIW